MMRTRMSLLTAAALIAGVTLAVVQVAQAQSAPGAAPAGASRVVFTPFPKGKLAEQVTSLWRTAPENANFVRDLDMVPDFMMGQMDVNGDGLPEVFARHSDENAGQCSIEENG